MKLLMFSDLHLHQWSEFNQPDGTGAGSRLAEAVGVLNYVLGFGVKEGCHAVLFAGDFFHDGKKVSPILYSAAMDALLAHRFEGGIYLMPGQHDYCYADPFRGHAVLPFGRLDGCISMDPLAYMDLKAGKETVGIYTCSTFTPMQAQLDSLKNVSSLANHDVVIFLGHFLVTELVNEAGYGDTLLNTVPAEAIPVFGKEDCWCFMGDFHEAVDMPEDRIYSVGRPMHHTFADSDRPLGSFLVFDTQTGEVERHTVPAPRFRTIRASDGVPDEGSVDYFRVVCESQDEADSFLEKAPDPSRVRIVLEEGEVEDEVRMKVDNPHNPKAIIKQYCEYRGVPGMASDGLKYVEEHQR